MYIGVYTSTTDPSVFYVLSENDDEIMAPESCFLLFSNYTKLGTLDLSNFNTSRVESMHYMFRDCRVLSSLDLGDKFYTSNVKYMQAMFYHCYALSTLDLGDNFNTENVTKMHQMFYYCKALTSLNLGDNFNTSSVKDMMYMFAGCKALNTIYATDKFSTEKVTSSNDMFYDCTSLVGGNGTVYDSNITDKTYAHIDGEGGLPGYFTDVKDKP